MNFPNGTSTATASHHFPPQVRDSLIRAAQTTVTENDLLARVRAIERAIDKARTSHPELFLKEF